LSLDHSRGEEILSLHSLCHLTAGGIISKRFEVDQRPPAGSIVFQQYFMKAVGSGARRGFCHLSATEAFGEGGMVQVYLRAGVIASKILTDEGASGVQTY